MIFQDISNHKQCESVKKEINRDLAMIKKKKNKNKPTIKTAQTVLFSKQKSAFNTTCDQPFMH